MPAEENGERSAGEQDLLAQLRQSLGLLRVAFDSADEVMLIADQNKRIRWANQKAADCIGTGITALLVGRTIDQCIQWQPWVDQSDTPDDDRHTHQPLSELILDHSGGDQQLRIRSTNKGVRKAVHWPARLTWRWITSMSETFLLLIIRDLDPIEKSLDRQRSFIQSLAHELRTPLALLTGNLMRVNRLLETSSPAASKLASAQQETERLKRLVDNLMLLSDLETGRYPWNWQILSLEGALLDWQQSLSHKKQSQLNIQLNQQSSLIRIDAGAFSIVMNQLLDNSVQFSDGLTKILIEAEITNDTITVFYQDSGPGVENTDRDQIASIFDRFQRLEQHRAPHRAEGGGLGLALAKELMEGMGGTLQLASPGQQAKGARRGIRFALEFQRAFPHQHGGAEDQAAPPVT